MGRAVGNVENMTIRSDETIHGILVGLIMGSNNPAGGALGWARRTDTPGGHHQLGQMDGRGSAQ